MNLIFRDAMSVVWTVARAVGLFAVTNIDDIVILVLFFAQARDRRGRLRIVVGQYLGFGAILVAAVAGAFGAGFLPESAIPYLGLLPIAIGVRVAWRAWSEHRAAGNRRGGPAGATPDDSSGTSSGPAVAAVAGVTFANGGDNIGVYVPVFTSIGAVELVVYVLVFLILVIIWCAAGYLLTSRPTVADHLSRWGHIVLPIVLVVLGLVILVEGHAFGL